MTFLYIKNGRVIDPSQSINEVKDLFIQDGMIVKKPNLQSVKDEVKVIDADGMWVVPGLIDGHVHLRQPGQEHKETIESGLNAAAAGGFTTVVSMPNTMPVADNVKIIKSIEDMAALLGGTNVCPASAITVGRQGKKLVNLEALANAGVTCFTDDGDGIENDEVMKQALILSSKFDVLLSQHSEFKSISKGGVVHDGAISKKLGLSGWPLEAEEQMVRRDIELVRKVGGKLHISHISSKGSIKLVRNAKKDGLSVTAEVTPHHLLLTDEILKNGCTNSKVCPPLRPFKHVEACRHGLADGTLDIIASDHAPHTLDDKKGGFEKAAFGMVGLEISVSLLLKLVTEKIISPIRMIEAMSTAPAKIFKLNAGTLKTGATADVTIINPNSAYKINPEDFLSKGKNTPFKNYDVPGKPVATIVSGKIIFDIL